MEREEKILMIPGPCEAAPNVLRVMGQPVMAHYMDQWMTVYDETIRMLEQVFQTRYDVFLITGSGTAGMEAAIASTIEAGDKVVGDGYFSDLVKLYGGEHFSVPMPRGEAVNPKDFRKKVKDVGDVKAIAVVHNSTGTGVTNPLKEIGEVAAESDVLLIVDSISSLGGIELRTDEWHVDLNCAASQKALCGVPGLAPVAVSERALEAMEKRKTPIRTRYLNLLDYKTSSQSGYLPTPYTSATAAVRGLHQSLRNILNEGLENVFNRHAVAARAVREGFKAMDFSLLVKDERAASNTVTTVKIPKGLDFKRFWRALFDRYNIMIGNPPPQQTADWARGVFRIGHMGYAAAIQHIMPTLTYVEKALTEVGFNLKPGAGVTAAADIFTE
jgi:aspartate aminotransferase-like enzyme